ncbi:preprotein translocase subunit SecY, partial [Pediococcus acidilactici]
ELIASIMFTLFMIVLMELGRQIAIPALDSDLSRKALNASPLLRNVTMLTGGQSRFPSLFSIGLGPYMTGMILFQAIQLINVDAMSKISDQKRGFIQRWITLIIAILQTLQFIFAIKKILLSQVTKFLGLYFNCCVCLFAS